MHRAGQIRRITDLQMRELHTNPIVVMSILNDDQNHDRYVKVINDGKVIGYNHFANGRRVTVADIA
jgi:hypothetical protein